MIKTLPIIDGATAPRLTKLIRAHAMRYEYRLDGSSLWEGRIRSSFAKGRKDMESAAGDSPAKLAWFRRQLAYATFKLPPGYEVVHGAHRPVLYFARSDKEQAIIGVQDTDVFLVHHPDREGYRWEVERLSASARRPREFFTGFEFTLAYRKRLHNAGVAWL